MNTIETLSAGFYGKMPANGDFVSRHLCADTQRVLSDWVGQVLRTSREQLADQWLSTYLTSPIWKFALPAGILGNSAYQGLYIPSVDKVGRYYPMILCQPTSASPLQSYCAHQTWFADAEAALLPVLEDDDTLENYVARVNTLSLPTSDTPSLHTQISPLLQMPESHSDENITPRVLTHTDISPSQITYALSDQYLHSLLPNYSLWWAYGSEHMSTAIAICQGLPAIDRFVAMLDGQWSTWGWSEHEAIRIDYPTEGAL